VATQCLKSAKCFRANAQYFANVCLKYVNFLMRKNSALIEIGSTENSGALTVYQIRSPCRR
jgi:hypothetical protein